MSEYQLKETVISKKEVYHGLLIRLEHWHVKLPNGDRALREVACHIGAAAIVALDDQGRVPFVHQHRVAIGRVTTEIPAGKFDKPDEDPLTAARRELSEETGLEAEHWEKLTVLDTTPGFCDEHIHIYLATGLSQGGKHPDPDEFVSVEWIPLEEAVDRVMRGELRDAKTVAGLMMAWALQHKNG